MRKSETQPTFCQLPPGWRAVVAHFRGEEMVLGLHPIAALRLSDDRYIPIYHSGGCFVDETWAGSEPLWCLAPGEQLDRVTEDLCRTELHRRQTRLQEMNSE